MERSVVLIKPDAIQRGLVGEVISRLEKKGLKLVGIKMMRLSDSILDEHYAHLRDKPFFRELKLFMLSTPIVATCWEGLDSVATIRELCGTTMSRKATAGTIRGDLAMSVMDNIVHASDTRDAALAEAERFFRTDEVFSYALVTWSYIYSDHE